MKHGRSAVSPAVTVTFAEAESNVGSRPNTTDTQTQTDRQTNKQTTVPTNRETDLSCSSFIFSFTF